MMATSLCCAHRPSVREREVAKSIYRGALSLVHEAQESELRNERADASAKYRQALIELQKASKLDPDDADIDYLSATVYFLGFGEHQKALTSVENAQKKRDDFPDALNLEGVILLDAGRVDEAIARLTEVRSSLTYMTPYYAEKSLGDAHMVKNDFERAKIHYQNALQMQPMMCAAYVKLGEATAALQEHEMTIQYTEEFFSRCDVDGKSEKVGEPLLSAAMLQLGDAYWGNTQKIEAFQTWVECERRFQGHIGAKTCGERLSAHPKD